MDSLAVSAISLAAGGWQNVKLVTIITQFSRTIPTWKLGICSIHTVNAMASAIAFAPPMLIAPGAKVSVFPDGQNRFYVQFNSSSITTSGIGTMDLTAVLFTWD